MSMIALFSVQSPDTERSGFASARMRAGEFYSRDTVPISYTSNDTSMITARLKQRPLFPQKQP